MLILFIGLRGHKNEPKIRSAGRRVWPRILAVVDVRRGGPMWPPGLWRGLSRTQRVSWAMTTAGRPHRAAPTTANNTARKNAHTLVTRVCQKFLARRKRCHSERAKRVEESRCGRCRVPAGTARPLDFARGDIKRSPARNFWRTRAILSGKMAIASFRRDEKMPVRPGGGHVAGEPQWTTPKVRPWRTVSAGSIDVSALDRYFDTA